METSPHLTYSPEELAATYRDEQEEPARQEQALAELIAAYADSAGDPLRAAQAGNQLTECLAPVVRAVARRVAQGASPGEKQDFVDEAGALILAPREGATPRICTYVPGRALEAWLYTVLHNLWVTDRRERLRRRRTLERFARQRRDPSPLNWDGAALSGPLSGADLERIAGWSCRRRVELLCLTGLCRLVPAERWEEWLADYERARQVKLGRPFPPDEILLCDEQAERQRPLAECLGCSANALAVSWLRSKDCLKELAFIRELTPT
jgi:DNA-directed RNA polymerase specialized sigma24 family protein